MIRVALLPGDGVGEEVLDGPSRLLRALARTDVPAPRPVAYCADPEVIGAPFVLMEFIADGVSLASDPQTGRLTITGFFAG